MAAASTGRRQARPDHRRAGAALRAGDLRRRRRPDPAAAGAGPLQPGGRQAARPSTSPCSASTTGACRRRVSAPALRRILRSFVGRQGSGRFDRSVWTVPACAWLSGRAHYLTGEFEDAATYQRLADRLRNSARRPAPTSCSISRPRPASSAASSSDWPRPGWSARPRAAIGGWWSKSRSATISPPRWRSTGSFCSVLDERQIYRMDHFLGKETVQNIMALRFGNGIFEPLWNRAHIDHVQITAAETVGVEGRGSFYEATGALRDMVPNHLFQLLAMTAMEAPNSLRRRRRAHREGQGDRGDPPPDAERGAVRRRCAGSTAPGTVAGRHVNAYRDEPNVAPRQPDRDLCRAQA